MLRFLDALFWLICLCWNFGVVVVFDCGVLYFLGDCVRYFEFRLVGFMLVALFSFVICLLFVG